ncbi:MAG TPA: response regulator, partial [Xanthobacteraceae bacterium]|nr:response regulator [Xanthobacteraceae bacterium]
MSSRTRVMVVDDEPAILRFLKPALVANDYEVVTAGTAAEATKRIAAEVPDVVVLDLGLPDGDGKDVIRRVREWSDVPIVVLSARDREAEKIAALDLGADDYVNKPFGVGELIARMRAALRHRMQRRAE